MFIDRYKMVIGGFIDSCIKDKYGRWVKWQDVKDETDRVNNLYKDRIRRLKAELQTALRGIEDLTVQRDNLISQNDSGQEKCSCRKHMIAIGACRYSDDWWVCPAHGFYRYRR